MGAPVYVLDCLKRYFIFPALRVLADHPTGHLVASASTSDIWELVAGWAVPFLLCLLLAVLVWVFSLRGVVREQTVVFLERVQRVVREFADYQRKSDALHKSEEKFRRLAENMRDIVWIVSLSGGKTLFVNTAFEKITGRTKQSLYSHPNCLDLILSRRPRWSDRRIPPASPRERRPRRGISNRPARSSRSLVALSRIFHLEGPFAGQSIWVYRGGHHRSKGHGAGTAAALRQADAIAG